MCAVAPRATLARVARAMVSGCVKSDMVRARPSTYWIDVAPTGRAKCRGTCKRLIAKGAWRLVEGARYMPGRTRCLSYCSSCARAVARFAETIRAHERYDA